jgi:hypothetical protein
MSKLKVEETVTRTYRATERLYQNKDKSALVPEDSPEASFLFAAPGTEVSEEDARKYGLLEEEEKAEEAPKPAEAPEPDKGPAREEPPPVAQGKKSGKKGK